MDDVEISYTEIALTICAWVACGWRGLAQAISVAAAQQRMDIDSPETSKHQMLFLIMLAHINFDNSIFCFVEGLIQSALISVALLEILD